MSKLSTTLKWDTWSSNFRVYIKTIIFWSLKKTCHLKILTRHIAIKKRSLNMYGNTNLISIKNLLT